MAAETQARERLAGSEAEWRAVAPLVRAESPEMLDRIRLAYLRGVQDVGVGPSDPIAAAQRLLDLLLGFGGIEDAPPDGRIPEGTFFSVSPS